MRTVALLFGVLATLALATLLIVLQPGGSGVAASMRLPDGSEYMVTQRCNWSAEPYTVAFYMRSAGGPWGWCYIDHQATRWRNVVMTYDPTSDVITVTERGVWQAELDRKHNSFSIGDGSPKRSLAAPQEHRTPEYAFP
ncbi:hypothetical protein [Verrucomicrobium sp. BvORR106]|uniref:hypothetical protein n=1 Tax=Verrucomicrobium sp. BvORR106 TaxID=1403819 RepID=UPI00056EE118|nr:hypothetical protein [Verrucomicrobium sp. BvORR106]